MKIKRDETTLVDLLERLFWIAFVIFITTQMLPYVWAAKLGCDAWCSAIYGNMTVTKNNLSTMKWWATGKVIQGNEQTDLLNATA